MKKILVINPFGVGDVLFSTPLLKAIKKRYPESSITYICNRRAYGVLEHNPRISNIHIFEKDEYRKLWKESKLKCTKSVHALICDIKVERFDAVIDMSLGYIYSLFLSIFTAIPIRIGFNYRNRGRFLSHKVDINGFSGKHVIEYYLNLGTTLNLDVTDKETELFVSPEDAVWVCAHLAEAGISDDDKVSIIIPGCGASWGADAVYRRWSPWKFAEVADHIARVHKYKIVVCGEAKELPICEKVLSEMKEPAIQMCGKTTLTQFAALLARSSLIVTNDGGPLHMAVALKKRTVSIFGPVDERIYGPYPPNGRHIIVTSDEECRPCYKNFKHGKCETLDCLKHIKPDKVLAAVEKLLKAKP